MSQPPDFSTFGKRLAHALKLSKVSRKDLAEKIGVSVQAVGQVINNDSSAMSAENCAKAAREMKISMYWLATGDGEPQEVVELSPDAMNLAKQYDNLTDREKSRYRAALILAMEPVSDLRIESHFGLPPNKKANDKV